MMKHSLDWSCELCGYDENPQEISSCDMCGLMPTDDVPISEFLNQQGIQTKE
jgi:hypothetical protein